MLTNETVATPSHPELPPEVDAMFERIDRMSVRLGQVIQHSNPQLGRMVVTELYVTPVRVEGLLYDEEFNPITPGISALSVYDNPVSGFEAAPLRHSEDGGPALDLGASGSVSAGQYTPLGEKIPLSFFGQAYAQSYARNLARAGGRSGVIDDEDKADLLARSWLSLEHLQTQSAIDKIAHGEQRTPEETERYNARKQRIVDLLTGKTRESEGRRIDAFTQELASGLDSPEKINEFEQRYLAALDSLA